PAGRRLQYAAGKRYLPPPVGRLFRCLLVGGLGLRVHVLRRPDDGAHRPRPRRQGLALRALLGGAGPRLAAPAQPCAPRLGRPCGPKGMTWLATLGRRVGVEYASPKRR